MDNYSANYRQDVEIEFEKKRDYYESHTRSSKNSGCEAVLQFMIDNPETIWWWSYEFIGRVNKKGDFLSHRAPARASDLALHYPELVEDRKVGRLKMYRARLENMAKILWFLGNSQEVEKETLF